MCDGGRGIVLYIYMLLYKVDYNSDTFLTFKSKYSHNITIKLRRTLTHNLSQMGKTTITYTATIIIKIAQEEKYSLSPNFAEMTMYVRHLPLSVSVILH